jgi:hypothetical protein
MQRGIEPVAIRLHSGEGRAHGAGPSGGFCGDARGAAARAVDGERAAQGFEPVGEAAQARTGGRAGTADAVVGDFGGERAVGNRDRDPRVGGVGVLGDVGERLGDREVDRRLDGRCEALV